MFEDEPPEPEAPPGFKWLTYEEAGRVLGVDAASIKRRALRNGWQRMPGNEGKTKVAVPAELLPQDIFDPGSWDRLAGDASRGETARELAEVLHGLAEDARVARDERDRLAGSVGALMAQLAARSATVAALELEIRRLIRRSPVKTTRGILTRLAKMKAQAEAEAASRPADTSSEPAA